MHGPRANKSYFSLSLFTSIFKNSIQYTLFRCLPRQIHTCDYYVKKALVNLLLFRMQLKIDHSPHFETIERFRYRRGVSVSLSASRTNPKINL